MICSNICCLCSTIFYYIKHFPDHLSYLLFIHFSILHWDNKCAYFLIRNPHIDLIPIPPWFRFKLNFIFNSLGTWASKLIFIFNSFGTWASKNTYIVFKDEFLTSKDSRQPNLHGNDEAHYYKFPSRFLARQRFLWSRWKGQRRKGTNATSGVKER